MERRLPSFNASWIFPFDPSSNISVCPDRVRISRTSFRPSAFDTGDGLVALQSDPTTYDFRPLTFDLEA
jgi:hypothetical protein